MSAVPESPSASSLPLSPTDSPTGPSVRPTFTTPLLIWLLLQGAALLVAVLRIPLSAGYLVAGERSAIYLLLAVQMGGMALLFPLLLRDWRSSAALASSSLPFIAIAAVMSSLSAASSVTASVYVIAWLAGLAF